MKKFSKVASAGVMAAAMLASSAAAFVAPIMNASAGQCLGETDFQAKGLPWHTCESPPAKQTFELTKGAYTVTLINIGGKANGGASRWDLQLRHRNLHIEKGHKYEMKWTIKSTAAGKMHTHIANPAGLEPVWQNNFGFDTKVWADPVEIPANTEKSFESTFTAPSTLEVAEWAFHYGGAGDHSPTDMFPKDTKITFSKLSMVCTTCPASGYTEGGCNWDPSNNFGIVTPKSNVRINQLGYYTNRAKIASWVTASEVIKPFEKTRNRITDSTPSTKFEILNSSGSVVYSGMSDNNHDFSKKSGEEDGDCVHLLDFSDFKTPGTYTIKVGSDVSHPFTIGDDIYKGLLRDSMNYYYQNRSGVAIETAYITSCNTNPKYKQTKAMLARPIAHNPDKAAVQSKWVKQYNATGSDMDTGYSITSTGGWYDAGDHGKYVVNGGVSVWTLQNMYEFAKKNGKESIIETAMVVPDGKGPKVLREARIELEWFFTMIVKSADPYWGKDYAGLVYHKLHDHKWTGLAVHAENYETEWETQRLVKPPSLAATLNLAATAAQASRLWKDADATFAAECLANAKLTYEKAQSLYSTWVPFVESKHDASKGSDPKTLYAPMDQAIGGGPYGDSEVRDDYYWAACELYATTKDAKYLDDIKKYGNDYKTGNITGNKDITGPFTVQTFLSGGENKGSFSSLNWGCTFSLGSLSLYVADVLTGADKEELNKSIINTSNKYIEYQKKEGHGIPYYGTEFEDENNLGPGIKIVGYEWGSNSFVINNAIAQAYAYDLTKEAKHLDGAVESCDYIFGRNAYGFSYVTGYGTYTLENPHHRFWSYELDKSFPKCPNGVMSGGPGAGMQDPYIGGLNYARGAVPSQRCFVDSIESWSTNEVTINWNAPLAWMTAFFDAHGNDVPSGNSNTTTKDTTGTPGKLLYGDANESGDVTIDDVVAVRLYCLKPATYPLTSQGEKNALVITGQQTVQGNCAVAIQDFVVEKIKSLPIAG